MNLAEFIDQLQENGQYTFTKEEVEKVLNTTNTAVKFAIYRQKVKGKITDPIRGFYIIIPPRYNKAGCLPPEQFIDDLMRYLNGDYYVGLLSAAELHGCAHQKPQVFQVVTNQKRRDIKCGDFKIVFVTKHDIKKTPTQQFKTPRGYYLTSSPEATAMDLILYPKHSAGINNVLTILIELAEKMDVEKLAQLTKINKETAWVQRLGYMLDVIGEKRLSSILHEKLKNAGARKRSLLTDKHFSKNAQVDKKWKIVVNAKLEADL